MASTKGLTGLKQGLENRTQGLGSTFWTRGQAETSDESFKKLIFFFYIFLCGPLLKSL